jgi:hypothetical protein
MNLVVARTWERASDARRAAAAAERNATLESAGTLNSTAGAVKEWRDYLMGRGRAEGAQRKLDDDIRKKLAEVERKKR